VCLCTGGPRSAGAAPLVAVVVQATAGMRSSVIGVKHIRTKWLARVERWGDCARSATWSWIKDEPPQLPMSRHIARSRDRHRYRPGGAGTFAAPEGLGFVSALSQGPQCPCGSDVFCARHDVRSGLSLGASHPICRRPARFGCPDVVPTAVTPLPDRDKLLSFNRLTTTARPCHVGIVGYVLKKRFDFCNENL
jgi:hypothetical protein